MNSNLLRPITNLNDAYDCVQYCECTGMNITVEKHYSPFQSNIQDTILNLDLILSQYCLCEEDFKVFENFNQVNASRLSVQNKNKKKLILEKMDFSAKLSSLYKQLDRVGSNTALAIKGKRKSDRQQNKSVRRSSYIGVSKNGLHWQAMISIKKRKTYIGTYDDQHEASKAFDFYSMLLHGLSAKTNNSYTKEQALVMIEHFKDPSNKNNF